MASGNKQGNAIRVACCLFTATIAFFVPFFGLISGLIGALGSSFLAFILPGQSPPPLTSSPSTRTTCHLARTGLSKTDLRVSPAHRFVQ
jgi:amino acid permease